MPQRTDFREDNQGTDFHIISKWLNEVGGGKRKEEMLTFVDVCTVKNMLHCSVLI